MVAKPRERSPPLRLVGHVNVDDVGDGEEVDPPGRRVGVADESAWLPAGAWQKCKADYTIEDGETVFAGLDVGGTRAATALVYITEDPRVGVQTWEGEEAVIYAEAALRELA